MRVDPRQPVLVGVGTCMQREEDFTRAREPLDLMLSAVQRAGADTGVADLAGLMAGIQHIAVPKGRWRYRNPAGEIARAVGAACATTVLASVGVLQQSLIGKACSRIAHGEIDCAIVTGADTGYRILRARLAGARAAERQQDDTPHFSVEPEEELLHPAELAAGIRMPIALYAILESAWRSKSGISLPAHQLQLNAMYQRFSEIAAKNPEAWRQTPVTVQELNDASGRNPMQAFPYTRLHCANWNVDQASALLLCSAAKAQSLGIAPSRWIYAAASTESNYMQAVSARADLTACVGARLAGQAALEAAGLSNQQPDLLDLYSCFPVAVQAYAQALGIDLARELTVTGGMPFAGGPFNNYVLQATCRMAVLMREGQGESGLVTSVSGILTKQGFGLWTRQPTATGFTFRDVSADAAQAAVARPVLESFTGPVSIAGYTVLHDKGRAPRALVLADTANGARALAHSEDPLLLQRMQTEEYCGARVEVDNGIFTAG